MNTLEEKLNELIKLCDEQIRARPELISSNRVVKRNVPKVADNVFNKEDTQRLNELFLLIDKDEEKKGITYRATPHLKEIDEIVKLRLSSEDQFDKDTLKEIKKILLYLAKSYDRLGRRSVSVNHYKKALELSATLSTIFGEEITDASEILYEAVYTRNYYRGSYCRDVYKLALTFMNKDIIDSIYERAMNDAKDFQVDPVEMTEKYLAVIDEVEAKIEQNQKYFGLGSCYHVWGLKRRYLEEKGVIWRSLSELNPDHRFE